MEHDYGDSSVVDSFWKRPKTRFPAGISAESMRSISLGLIPSIGEGRGVAVFDATVSKEEDERLRINAAVAKAYFVQIALDLRAPRSRESTTPPVAAIEYLEGRTRGEDTWLSLLRQAVVQDLERITPEADTPTMPRLIGTNRNRSSRKTLSIGSIEEIAQVVLAANGDNFSTIDLQTAGIYKDVYEVYPGKYKGLKKKFGLPEIPKRSPQEMRRKAPRDIRVFPSG